MFRVKFKKGKKRARIRKKKPSRFSSFLSLLEKRKKEKEETLLPMNRGVLSHPDIQ